MADIAALCRRIAAGDPAAFAQFYEAWFDVAFALARASSRRDESFCLDVVQDVMLKVVQRLPCLPDERALRGWLAATVRTTALDRLRAEQRAGARERQRASLVDAMVPPADHDSERGEQERWLQEQMAALTAPERALLEARFGGELSMAAVGAAHGMTADAAQGRLRRLMKRLQQAAEQWWKGA